MNIVILLGAPGSGKGTVAAKLAAENANLKHVSSGDLLRGAVAKGTEAGKAAKDFMEAGKLVPDELIATMIKYVIAESTGDVTMLLDGFPRTIAQAEALDKVVAHKGAGDSAEHDHNSVGADLPAEDVKRRKHSITP